MEPLLEQRGQHLKASCPSCGAYIKFLGQGGPPTLYFGKYKGETLAQVAHTDPRYLRWLREQDIKPALIEAINEILGPD